MKKTYENHYDENLNLSQLAAIVLLKKDTIYHTARLVKFL